MPMPMHRHLLLVPLALLPVVITTRHGDAATTAATEAPAAACSTWYERTAHSTTGVWRSVQDPRFGAKGDGVTDDTAAIQKALDYRKDDNSLKISPQKTWGQPYPPGNCSYGDCQLYQKAPSIVYLPPGRYVISDTLVLLFHTHLVGNFRCPPTIVLKPSSRGFTNRSFGLKPAIAAANGFNSSLHNWWNSFGTPGNPAKRSGGENMVFFTQILHLRLEIGAGNSAATGIMWGVAQQTTIRDVEIEGGPAAVGLDISGKSNYAKTGPQGVGVGGGGTIEDIQIRGAEVGLKIASSQWALRGITLSGAASVGILGEQNTNVQFVDLDVSHTPLGIHLSSGLSYVILDSSFRAISGGTAISTSRPIFLENVTTDASIKSLVNKAGPVGLHRTEAYWQGAAYLHGTHSPHSSGIVAASRMRRVSRPRPTFETVSGKDPANLLSFGAKGDGIQDDTEAFVRAIAAADVVFVPWGLFRVTDTLQLRSRTKLVGEGLAHIWLGNYSSGYDDPQHPKALIQTSDDAEAENVLADLEISCGSGNPGAVSVHWMAGGSTYSGMWDVHLPFYLNAQVMLLHLDKQGGGTFSNMWLWGADHDPNTDAHIGTAGTCCSAWPNRHGFLATSSGEAWFYGVASEHDMAWAWKMENASNIVMVGTPQTEHSPIALEVTNCEDVEIFGVLATAMRPGFYKHGLPALITMSNNSRTRLVAANVCDSAMIVNSTDENMRVHSGGTGFKSAIIAWDTSVNRQ